MDGGAETTAALIQSLVLAFLAYPECQKKAQDEMDQVIGASRMLVLDDYEKLPYLRAFVNEVSHVLST